jgi:glucosamine 6-phosphate synthetase-like amidotransferase/phosphosugar isomerase protein
MQEVSTMCGIIGLVLGDKVRSEGEYERIRVDFSTMLVAAQARGVDAAGLYIVNAVPGQPGVRQYVHSAGIPAQALVTTAAYWQLLDNIGPDTIAIVGHTRHATTGSPKVNSNNHPIVDGPLVGVHNGVIFNHAALRRQYGAVAEVDSAAILSTLRAQSQADALEVQDFRQAMPKVSGSWAIAISDSRRQAIFLARNDGSPMQLAHEKKRRALWFASTTNILTQGLGHEVKAQALPMWSVARLTRANANTGKVSPKTVAVPKVQRPAATHGLEDWQRSTSVYESPSSTRATYPSFFDQGSTTAAALKAARN